MPVVFAFLSSPIEWLVVLGIALLLFGNRLPSTMRSLGRGVIEFKKGLQGIEDDDTTPTKTAIKTETVEQEKK